MTIVALAISAIGIFAVSSAFSTKLAGAIQVAVVDIEDSTIADKTIKFNEGDQIDKLLEENFDNVVIKDRFLYSIDQLTTPEDWSTFICLYVDGEMSQVGIFEVEFTDGTLISFVDTEMSY